MPACNRSAALSRIGDQARLSDGTEHNGTVEVHANNEKIEVASSEWRLGQDSGCHFCQVDAFFRSTFFFVVALKKTEMNSLSPGLCYPGAGR